MNSIALLQPKQLCARKGQARAAGGRMLPGTVRAQRMTNSIIPESLYN